MKKIALSYLIAGVAGLVLAALPVQAKDCAKSSTRLAKGKKVLVANVIVSAPPVESDAESFRNDHPAGGD